MSTYETWAWFKTRGPPNPWKWFSLLGHYWIFFRATNSEAYSQYPSCKFIHVASYIWTTVNDMDTRLALSYINRQLCPSRSKTTQKFWKSSSTYSSAALPLPKLIATNFLLSIVCFPSGPLWKFMPGNTKRWQPSMDMWCNGFPCPDAAALNVQQCPLLWKRLIIARLWTKPPPPGCLIFWALNNGEKFHED